MNFGLAMILGGCRIQPEPPCSCFPISRGHVFESYPHPSDISTGERQPLQNLAGGFAHSIPDIHMGVS